MVKAVSEETLKTVSPVLKANGAGIVTTVFSFTPLTCAFPANSSFTVKARPAISVLGCTLIRSPTWSRSLVSKVIRSPLTALMAPRKRPVAPFSEGVAMSVGVWEARNPFVGTRPKESLRSSFAWATASGPLPLRRIECQPVGSHHARHVLGRLHPSLDLQRCDPGVDQLRQHVDAGKVVGGEVVPFLPPVLVLPAAGLGATAAVAAVASQKGREVALSGDREAERAVDEALDTDPG